MEKILFESALGIPDEIKDKILQPFFTTKDVGVGTGLGLSLSKGIAEMHGGSLQLDSSAKYTTFILSLPKNQAA
ncbi:MAG: ATP-binding protein [Oligoflexales bacterium]